MMKNYLVKESGIGMIPGVYPGIPKGSIERFSDAAAARILAERPKALELHEPKKSVAK